MDGILSVLISVDANAAIDYVRECALHKLGWPPTGRRAEELRVCLGRMTTVIVSETAGREALRNLKKDIKRKLGSLKGGEVYSTAAPLLREYLEVAQCPDNIDNVPSARKMYAEINADSSDPRLAEWTKKKGEALTDPVLGSDVNDLTILSTTAYYVQFCEVEFWTHDMDFTMFADEIRRTFDVRVVDTYRLGGRFL